MAGKKACLSLSASLYPMLEEMRWTQGEKFYESPTLSPTKENSTTRCSTKTGTYPGAPSENRRACLKATQRQDGTLNLFAISSCTFPPVSFFNHRAQR